MTLKVNDLIVEGTVDEIVEFLEKYNNNPNRHGFTQLNNGFILHCEPTSDDTGFKTGSAYKDRVESFEKNK